MSFPAADDDTHAPPTPPPSPPPPLPPPLATNRDTPTSAATRFAIEVVAWIAGPWAAYNLTRSLLSAATALVVLVGMPAALNTPGDKNVVCVAVPGLVRVLVEAGLAAVAVGGAWLVWPALAAVAVTSLSVALVVTGLRRYRWLLQGATSDAFDTDVADLY